VSVLLAGLEYEPDAPRQIGRGCISARR